MAHCFTIVWLVFLIMTGCEWKKSPKPSVLVIAVESLGFEQVTCSSSTNPADKGSGFDLLCEEAVRFTHAYTPSVMSQSALASILTGLHPYESGVWNNGSKFLSAKIRTAAETALERGYRTAFFTGGPPIWSFSGLDQGFERFVDHFVIKQHSLFRPARENFALFLNWVRNLSANQPFFSVIYLPDLQFDGIETMTDLGESRGAGYESQLAEINESLVYLIGELRKDQRWDKTHVIFAGLNGVANKQKPHDVKGLNLSSTNTQVALLIKPSRTQRDLGINWKIDKNVSLVDVGTTIFDLLGEQVAMGQENRPDTVSLKPVFYEPTAQWDEKRIILTETSWPQWLSFGQTRFSVRIGHLLFVYDQSLKIYNTLVDRLETASIGMSDASVKPFVDKAIDFFVLREFEPWENLSLDLQNKWFLGSELWRSSKVSPDIVLGLNSISERRPADSEMIYWLAELALLSQNWSEFELLADRIQNPIWKYFALRAQGKVSKLERFGCLKLFDEISSVAETPGPKLCDDETFISLVMWISRRTNDSAAGGKYRTSFLRAYQIEEMDREIVKANYRAQMIWNVDYKNTLNPSLSRLTLALPEFSKERMAVEKEIGALPVKE